MHTGRVIVTGVLHGCDHTYIALCSRHYHLHISAAHSGIEKVPVDPLVGGGSMHQRKALNHTTTKFVMGSFGLNPTALRESSILDPCYKT